MFLLRTFAKFLCIRNLITVGQVTSKGPFYLHPSWLCSPAGLLCWAPFSTNSSHDAVYLHVFLSDTFFFFFLQINLVQGLVSPKDLLLKGWALNQQHQHCARWSFKNSTLFSLEVLSVLLPETFSRSPLSKELWFMFKLSLSQQNIALSTVKCVPFFLSHCVWSALGLPRRSFYFQLHSGLNNNQLLHVEASFAVFHSVLTCLTHIPWIWEPSLLKGKACLD